MVWSDGEGPDAVCREQGEKDKRIAELAARVKELEEVNADLLPDAQRGSTWIYKRGPEYLKWLKAIAQITNRPDEGFYSGQRTLKRVQELAADRDGLLLLIRELSDRK
jgi:hypothetical protein